VHLVRAHAPEHNNSALFTMQSNEEIEMQERPFMEKISLDVCAFRF
jgi:hypothetical protein